MPLRANFYSRADTDSFAFRDAIAEQEKTVRIIVADNNSMVQLGISYILKSYWHKAQISFAENFDQILQQLNKPADLLISEIDIPGGYTFRMIDKLKQKQCNLKVLLFSSYNETIYATRYLDAGAEGYLSKYANEDEILHAVCSVMSGRRYTSSQISQCLFDVILSTGGIAQNPINSLSNRELEISMFLLQGLGGLEIGNMLDIRPGTISTYKKRIFEKLRIKNLTELKQKFDIYFC